MSSLEDKRVEHWTLAQVCQRGEIAFECCKCWRIAKMSIQTLAERCDTTATVGNV